MPTRAFNGGTAADRIITSAGNAPAIQGPITVAVLAKITSGFSGTAWMIDADDATFERWGMLVSGGQLFYDNDFGGGPIPPTGAWVWLVGSKPVGASLPRWHVKNVTTGGAWSHANGASNVNDFSGAATEIILGGQFTGGASTTWRGSIAAVAAWPKVLADLDVEAYCTLLAKDLRLAEPSWGVLLNQASTATALMDFTGNGGNQTAISGTSVDSDVPPGFDFTLPTVEHLLTSQVPSGHNFFENAPTTLATTVKFATAGYVTGGRFWAPTNPAGTYDLVLWRATNEDATGGTGTVIGTVSFNQVIKADSWNSVAFATPIAVDTTHVYKIGIRSSVGSYTATGSFFGAAEVVNGNVTGLQADTLYPGLGSYHNGSFDGTITGYPATQFNQTCYFVDVSFLAGSAPTGASPTGLAIPLSLGQPAVAIPSAAPSGQVIPVATGQPSVALARLANPSGLAIPVAIGQPSTVAPVASDSPNRPVVATPGRKTIVAASGGQPIVATTHGRAATR